ncbi:hypothetical protein MNBD_DELTA01-1610 [hydrothermal vent metagenome]|uniref:Uncharacterized protein n=1 Tax=hydrothermal vent metagenome TaxID=652676 RepID=A0A3B0QL11_9ZZZZ
MIDESKERLGKAEVKLEEPGGFIFDIRLVAREDC